MIIWQSNSAQMLDFRLWPFVLWHNVFLCMDAASIIKNDYFQVWQETDHVYDAKWLHWQAAKMVKQNHVKGRCVYSPIWEITKQNNPFQSHKGERHINTSESQCSWLTTVNIKITNIRIHVQCTMPYLVPKTYTISVINNPRKQ
jgi:hypothetical protein